MNVKKVLSPFGSRSDSLDSRLYHGIAEITQTNEVTITWGYNDMRTEFYDISVQVIEFEDIRYRSKNKRIRKCRTVMILRFLTRRSRENNGFYLKFNIKQP